MYEFDYFDGDHYIIFDIVEIDDDKETITVAISNQGRITQDTFDLHYDYNLEDVYDEIRYFEYGLYANAIYIKDFENF